MPTFKTADGTQIFYRDWGEGAPVVFLSSWALSSAMWGQQMESLRRHGYRCIAYDRRGHGRSDDPGRGYDYETLAGDLAALVHHLDLRGITFVTHSMSGGEVVRYLARHGEARAARVAFISPMLPFPTKAADNPAGVPPEMFAAARDAFARDFPRWLADNAAGYVGAGLPGCDVAPATVDWTIRDILQSSLQAVVECNRAIETTDFRRECAGLGVPALIVHGDRDQSIPAQLSAEATWRLVPGARLVIYENAPHAIYLTHAARLDEELLGFIRSTPPVQA